MSYNIIKAIHFINNRVYLTIYSESSLPSDAFRSEAPEYSELLRKQGRAAVLKDIARKCLAGQCYLENSSPICRYLNQGLKLLKQNRRLDRVLDADLVAGFMAHCAVKRLQDPEYQPTEELDRLVTLCAQKNHGGIKPGIDSIIQNASQRAGANMITDAAHMQGNMTPDDRHQR